MCYTCENICSTDIIKHSSQLSEKLFVLTEISVHIDMIIMHFFCPDWMLLLTWVFVILAAAGIFINSSLFTK